MIINLDEIEMTSKEMKELTALTGPLGLWNGAKVLKKLKEVQHENMELLAERDKFEERNIVECETAYENGYNIGCNEGV